MNDFPPGDGDRSSAPPPYAYPPPPPATPVWPPPPGGVTPTPMPLFPTQTNAVLILVLGIASIPTSMLCGVGGLIGILPWVMGNASLRAIDQGLANPMERGMVNGGRICGIVGAALAALMLAFGVIMMAYSLSTSHGR